MFHPQQYTVFFLLLLFVQFLSSRVSVEQTPISIQQQLNLALAGHGRRRLNLFTNLVPDLEAIESSTHAPLPLLLPLGVPCPCPCKIPAPIFDQFRYSLSTHPLPHSKSQCFGPGFPPALVRRRTRAKRVRVKVQG